MRKYAIYYNQWIDIAILDFLIESILFDQSLEIIRRQILCTELNKSC